MQTLVGVAGYSATVKGVVTRKSLGTTVLVNKIFHQSSFYLSNFCHQFRRGNVRGKFPWGEMSGGNVLNPCFTCDQFQIISLDYHYILSLEFALVCLSIARNAFALSQMFLPVVLLRLHPLSFSFSFSFSFSLSLFLSLSFSLSLSLS